MRRIALLAVAIAGVLGFIAVNQAGVNAGLPANKVTASGSVAEVAGPEVDIVVLSERIRTSAPADLLLDFNSECAILTDLTTTADDEASASGIVRAWIEIDGEPVPVATEDADVGRITLCDRATSRTTSGWANNPFGDDDTIETTLKTRDANGFSWMALNVGPGIHTVEVHAFLDQQTTGDATAEVAIGKRTLTISPTHAAVRETVSDV